MNKYREDKKEKVHIIPQCLMHLIERNLDYTNLFLYNSNGF